ncbi:MAG: hypothetical protein QM681_14655 [Novosphingobium sp.]
MKSGRYQNASAVGHCTIEDAARLEALKKAVQIGWMMWKQGASSMSQMMTSTPSSAHWVGKQQIAYVPPTDGGDYWFVDFSRSWRWMKSKD